MASSSNADIAVGITITTTTFTFNYQVVDVNFGSQEVEDIDVSHQGTTTARRFKPADLRDNGDMTLSVHHNPDTIAPIGTTGTITVRWPGGTNWGFGGYTKSYGNITGTLNEKMTADVVVKISGPITATTS